MRVAFDIAALDEGGAERQTLEVAAGLRDLGHDVLVVVNKRADHFAEYFARVPITELDRMNRWDMRVVADVRRALLAFRADACVCVLFNASLWGRLAAALARCPVIVAEHSTKALTPAPERLTNILMGPVTRAVVACAEAQVDALVRGGHQRRKIRIVRNGVDVDRFRRNERAAVKLREALGIPADAPVVMLAAAHRLEKRHDRFVALVEHLHQQKIPAWGLMVGGGPLLEQSAALAEASPVAEWLRVTGPIADMPAAYSAADVLVLVSDDIETFPLSFLEAQACEVPVVGMDTGGVRETLVEGRTGFTVRQGDKRAMVQVVGSLLIDHDRRASIGRAGRQFVREQLSTTAMVQGYAEVLNSVVNDSGACQS